MASLCGMASKNLGRFPFEKLVKFYSLDQINQAAQDGEKGGTIEPIIIRLSPA